MQRIKAVLKLKWDPENRHKTLDLGEGQSGDGARRREERPKRLIK